MARPDYMDKVIDASKKGPLPLASNPKAVAKNKAMIDKLRAQQKPTMKELMPGEKPGWRKGPNWIPASGGQEKPFTARSGRRLLYVWDTRSGDHAYLDLGTDMILSPEEAEKALALDSVQPNKSVPKDGMKEAQSAPTSAQIRNRAESLKSLGARGDALGKALRREFGDEYSDATENAMYDIGEVVNRKTLVRLVKEELFNYKFERILTEGYEKHINNILDDAGIGGYHWAYGTMHFGSAKIMQKAKEVLERNRSEIYELPPMVVDTNEAVGANWKKDTTSGSYGAPIKSPCPSCGNPWSVDLGVSNGMHFHGCLKCNKTFIPNAGVKEADKKFQSVGSLGNKPPSDDMSKMPGEEEAEKALKGEATTGPTLADVRKRAGILLQAGVNRAQVAKELEQEFPDAPAGMIKQVLYTPTFGGATHEGKALQQLRKYVRESVRHALKEKWEGGADIKKVDKFGKAEQPLSAIKSQAANLRDKEDKTAAQSHKLKQLNFAIRARTGWGKAKNEDVTGDPADQMKTPWDKSPVKKESAPKGWEGTVKAMKKHKDISNPFALAHYMKNKGMKSHKEAVMAKVREAIQHEIRKAIKESTNRKK